MTPRHHVLLVEDNVPDIVFAQKALSVLSVELTVAMGAEEGLAMLEALDIDLVLLDLNLPKLSGFEFLRRAKESPLRHIPVVVLTSSSSDDDVRRAYDVGASGYLIKPLTLRQYQSVAGKLGDYWFESCRLPVR